MKKICTLLMATVVISFGINNKAMAQVEEGSVLTDVYYGFPNGIKMFNDAFDTGDNNYTSKGLGGMGLRFEYMIADNLGVGFDVNYTSGNATYTVDDDSTVYDAVTDTYTTTTFSWTVGRKKSKTRIMARLNYHFVSTDVVDAYVGFGAGYRLTKTEWTSTQPGASDTSVPGIFDGFFPVALKLALGTRFYFTENLGAHLELGVGGGPVIAGGLSLKF